MRDEATHETPNHVASDQDSAAGPSEVSLKVGRYFPTLIFSLEVPDSEHLNTRLIEAIHAERERDKKGVRKSNYRELGGWHSHTGLHKDAAFAGMVRHVDAAAATMCRRLGYHRSYRLSIGTMWSIVNPPGGLNRAHIHPGCIWSGVYYVQAPRNSGRIEFTDPRTQNLMGSVKYIPRHQAPTRLLEEGPLPAPGRKNAYLPRLAVPQRGSESIQGQGEGRRPRHRELQPVPAKAELTALGGRQCGDRMATGWRPGGDRVATGWRPGGRLHQDADARIKDFKSNAIPNPTPYRCLPCRLPNCFHCAAE